MMNMDPDVMMHSHDMTQPTLAQEEFYEANKKYSING